MAFFLLCVYWAMLLIRPQELIPSLENMPVLLYTLILTVIPFLFSKKNAGSPQLILLIFLLIVIAISAILNGWSGSIFILVPEFTSGAVIPFILFSKMLDSTQKHKLIIAISIIAALVMVHNGMSQKSSDIGIGWAGNKLSEGTRITYLGLLADPNDLGMFFVMNIPLVIYCVFHTRGIAKFLWTIAFVFILYGIYLTNSRGAFLGVLSMSGLWLLHNYGVARTLLSSSFLLPIVFIVASKFRTIDAQEESAAGRIEAWYEGFQMLIQHPFFGVGMNRFMEYHHLTAHNSYVLIAAELGFLGFTLWISFIVLTFFMLFQVAFYNKPFIKNSNSMRNQIKVLSANVLDEILLARVYLFSLLGFVVTAFFLSRCYAFMLFIYAGMGVSVYYRALLVIPDLKPITFGQVYHKLLIIAAACLVLLYLVVRILT